MSKKILTVNNASGIHARPASLLVKTITKFKSDVRVIKNNNEYNAKSIMGILSLGAKKGDELTFIAEGTDEHHVIAELETLFASNFGE